MPCFPSGPPPASRDVLALVLVSTAPLNPYQPLDWEAPRPQSPLPTLSMDSSAGLSAFYLLVPPMLSSSQVCMRP